MKTVFKTSSDEPVQGEWRANDYVKKLLARHAEGGRLRKRGKKEEIEEEEDIGKAMYAGREREIGNNAGGAAAREYGNYNGGYVE